MPNRAISSSRRGDLGRHHAHLLDGRQRSRGDPVCGQRSEQQCDGTADEQEGEEVRERLAPRGGRGADDHDSSQAARDDGNRQQTRGLPQSRQRTVIDEDGFVCRAAQLGGAQQDAAAHRGGRVQLHPPGIENLGDALRIDQIPVTSLAGAEVCFAQQHGHVVGTGAQPRVEGAVELVREPQVYEHSRRTEHERHHTREHERDAQPDREAPQRPPSLRMR
jgi:hypothetical protein